MMTSWGSTHLAIHGELVDATEQDAVVAWADEQRVGMCTYRRDPSGSQWEIVSIDATVPGRGVGTALLAHVVELARTNNAERIWLVTTNENIRALRFFQRRKFNLVRLHVDAVTSARLLKPTIPMEDDGIPIRPELELEVRFAGQAGSRE